jgi:hypothetical protein
MGDGPVNPIRRGVDRVGALLPCGWRDFWLQAAIFWSYFIAYEAARTLAANDRYLAMRNALDVLRAQQDLGILWERSVQAWAIDAPGVVMQVMNWTYVHCQFTITYALVMFIYFRRNHAFAFVRNVLMATSFAALIGYIMLPTAPPRMMGGLGFVDTLQQVSVNHQSGIVAWFANPYAAMPSLHTAYAVIIGAAGVLVFANPLLRAFWALYPVVVVLSIVTTGNHWLLDAMAGAFLALFAMVFAFALSRGRIPTLASARPATAFSSGAPPVLTGAEAPVPQRA